LGRHKISIGNWDFGLSRGLGLGSRIYPGLLAKQKLLHGKYAWEIRIQWGILGYSLQG
jgi:hypothetical protein